MISVLSLINSCCATGPELSCTTVLSILVSAATLAFTLTWGLHAAEQTIHNWSALIYIVYFFNIKKKKKYPCFWDVNLNNTVLSIFSPPPKIFLI